MRQEEKILSIPVRCGYTDVGIRLNIVPSSENSKLYYDDEPDACESSYQLVEGNAYQYEFEEMSGHKYQFSVEDDIVRFSSFSAHPNMGTINTGNYVGQLHLDVVDTETKVRVGDVRIEIRSVKSDYERDYRIMLDDIALYYTDLVLLQGSPVRQSLEVDENATSQTLYQKFSFVRSVVESEPFQEAIHKIMVSPVRKWTGATICKKTEGVRRLSRKNIRQIASSNDRMALPEGTRFGGLSSVPKTLEVEYKRDTTDNQENQFVKFALKSFSDFCTELGNMPKASCRLKEEVTYTVDRIDGYLNTQFFRHISAPTHLSMNSPVLQRKEGYREVLQAWLLFDLSAKLNWDGGDNIYDAGKKNVATLYEYWLFFKLQELISGIFTIKKSDKEKLVTLGDNGINLNVKQGRMIILTGRTIFNTRILNVAFYYNRTYTNDLDIRKSGSWSVAMRPDYTLSIWPGEIDEGMAEELDLITHIHFDAKYRLSKIPFENGKDVFAELNREKVEQERGEYKRVDLLKMHAYKDAIRRTSGAYVLYPGTENRALKGYHEIIPGLGAFSIRPGHWNDDSESLKDFLSKVIDNMLDRASEREKSAYYNYNVHKEEVHESIKEYLPEAVGDNRDFMPDKTSVIIAYYKSEEHLKWIEENHLYNVRAGELKGAVTLNSDFINARYILLYDRKGVRPLIRLKREGPKVYTRAELIRRGYPRYKGKDGGVDEKKEKSSAHTIYLVFSLNQTLEKELQNYAWDLSSVVPHGKLLGKPRTMSLVELLRLRRR